MSKKLWFAIAISLLLTWGADQVTKQWALRLQGVKTAGPFMFLLHFNQGAILGTFSDLPPVLRVVTLSTGGAFLIFCFIVLQALLAPPAPMLRCGMGILLGGILGNVTDRILTGRIVDFVIINYGNWHSPAFNIADALQWVGYAMIVIDLAREGKNLWPTYNQRKSFWINPSYQLRYSAKITGFGLSFAAIAGTLSYTYLKVSMDSITGFRADLEEKFLFPFAFTFMTVSLIFCGVLFIVGLMLSHRSAGPLYAFERFLSDLIGGQPRKLRLRQGDEFRQLESLADKVLTAWPNKVVGGNKEADSVES